MGGAKDIVLRPIDRKTANALVKRVHYSGKVVNNSQVHIGVFWQGRLEGALQFGPSLDKRKVIGLVDGTKWNEFIELNRMAFTDTLPKNSESRALAVAFRILRKHAPQLRWVISFADATQSGHGTIYQAAGFVLTGVKENTVIYETPAGRLANKTTFSKGAYILHISNGGAGGARQLAALGATKASGFQLRYIYFLDKSWRDRLTVPEIPYSKVWEMGAAMLRGEKLQCAGEATG